MIWYLVGKRDAREKLKERSHYKMVVNLSVDGKLKDSSFASCWRSLRVGSKLIVAERVKERS